MWLLHDYNELMLQQPLPSADYFDRFQWTRRHSSTLCILPQIGRRSQNRGSEANEANGGKGDSEMGAEAPEAADGQGRVAEEAAVGQKSQRSQSQEDAPQAEDQASESTFELMQKLMRQLVPGVFNP
eukprot:6178125-Pleurochrysis_carterae.AAC.1